MERMKERRRLVPDERRNQLLDIGAHEFATRAYDEVRMVDVASGAGVSRALVYRYFPTKRDLFAAIYQRAADRLLTSAEFVDDVPMADQVIAGLDAHIDFFVANARTVLVANQGPLAGDPTIQAIISEELSVIRQRMLDAIGLHGPQRAVASAALAGWLSFVRAACVEWLAQQTFSRDELREMCLRTLASALDDPHFSPTSTSATISARRPPATGCHSSANAKTGAFQVATGREGPYVPAPLGRRPSSTNTPRSEGSRS
jgi:AcrR family transcriptional regulator